MEKIANCKVTVQCDSRDIAERIVILLEALDESLLFTTGITPNTREPFLEGVHLSLFYRLKEDNDNGTLQSDRMDDAV